MTHLVTDSCRGERYRYASTFGIPVMSGEWIKSAWTHRNDFNFKATQIKFVDEHKVKPFHGAHIHFIGFDANEMDVMESELVRNGGKLCPDFRSEHCTHIVVDDSKSLNLNHDEIRREIPVVKVEWFWTSIQMDACAEEKLHLYSDPGLNFLSPNGSVFSPGTPGNYLTKCTVECFLRFCFVVKTSVDNVILQIFDIFTNESSLFFNSIEFLCLNKVI